MAFQLQPLSPDKQRLWLVEHIPHRIRGMLPGLPMRGPWLLPALKLVQENEADRITMRCWGNSVWEGRLTSMRWLIMFVGIQEEKGAAVETRIKHQTDMRIDAISAGAVFNPTRPEALTLAQAWKGCSQATSHPTQDTNHPDVSEKPLAEALHIVIEHLEHTIYAANGHSLPSNTITMA